MLVIETTVSYDNIGKFCDHQSRVIEVDSWENYVESYINSQPQKYQGTMHGYNYLKDYKMSGLKYDDFHLSCDFDNGVQKLAYRIHDVFELKFNSDKL